MYVGRNKKKVAGREGRKISGNVKTASEVFWGIFFFLKKKKKTKNKLFREQWRGLNGKDTKGGGEEYDGGRKLA